jgi:hypothetical protein
MKRDTRKGRCRLVSLEVRHRTHLLYSRLDTQEYSFLSLILLEFCTANQFFEFFCSPHSEGTVYTGTDDHLRIAF